MENASKALLIAASVLIVILLVAFGMKIFNSPQEVSKDAKKTGEAISTSTGKAAERFESVTNAGKKEEGEKEEITFTIDGETCKAKKGMTWLEWVNSSYNNIGVEIADTDFGRKILYNGEEVFPAGMNTSIDPDDAVIDENHNYRVAGGNVPR